MTEKKYFIVASLEGGREIVDGEHDRQEANRLRREYQMAFKCPVTVEVGRIITNRELCDLPTDWENSKTGPEYIDSALEAWEVSETLYKLARSVGDLCQEYEGKFYIA